MAHARDVTLRVLRAIGPLVAAAAIFGGYLTWVRPWLLDWGATPAERAQRLPGDELARHGWHTRALTVEAQPDRVWPWIMRLGQERAGFYSYDWLENNVGAGIHNSDDTVARWPDRRAGDFVRSVSRDYLGGGFEEWAGWRVQRVDPGRAMVLDGWGAFVVAPLADGRSRLLVRTHTPARHGLGRALDLVLGEPAHFVMERRMMLGLRARAVGLDETPPGLATAATVGWCAGGVLLLVLALASRRRAWPFLLPPIALALAVNEATGDVRAALACFVGWSTCLVGARLSGRRWAWWIVGLAVYTFVVFALATDAWVTFGLGYLVVAVAFAVQFAPRRWRRARPVGRAGAPT